MYVINDIFGSHIQSKNMCIMYQERSFLTIIAATGGLRVLNYLNCLHELCVKITAAALTADLVDKQSNKWAK